MTIDERVMQAVEGLRALKIVDEVRSDNPLACDAADLITDLHAALKEAERERDEARTKVYVLGEFYCPKCNFGLSQFRMDAATGAIGDRDDPGEKCPNDGSPLWRVTWERRALEHYDRASEEMKRADALAADLERAREPERVKIAQAVFDAALKWCGEKERETSNDDVAYFKNNWRDLPGLRQYVEIELGRAFLASGEKTDG